MKNSGERESSKNTFPKKSVQGDAHTFGDGKKEYDVYMLIDLASSITAVEFSVSELSQKVLSEECWNDEFGNKFSPRRLLDAYRNAGAWEELLRVHPEWKEHIEKIVSADYRHPILLHRGELIDGMHRLLRAIVDGTEYIPSRNFDVLPDEALVSRTADVK